MFCKNLTQISLFEEQKQWPPPQKKNSIDLSAGGENNLLQNMPDLHVYVFSIAFIPLFLGKDE